MTVLAEEFVDAFDDLVNLTDFPPTFETLTPGVAFPILGIYSLIGA